MIGQGLSQKKRNTYKVDKEGKYTSTELMIDPIALANEYRIRAYKGGNLIYEDQGDRSLYIRFDYQTF